MTYMTLCLRLLQAGCGHMLQVWVGQVPPTASSSHQPQSAASDLRSGVYNMLEECDAACSRDLDHDSSYTESPLTL